MIELQRWYSLEEIANYLGVSKDTIHRWIRNKGMPAHKIGRLWKFKLSEVDQWVTDSNDSESGSRSSKRPKPAAYKSSSKRKGKNEKSR